MAEENLKDFSINWILTGFLFVCLLGFSIHFMFNNNPGGFGSDTDSVFNNTYNSLNPKLIESTEDSNTLLNITSKTNPEVSDLGSRDSVASAYSAKGSASQYWESSKQLLSWVFSGDTGAMIISVIGGIMGFLSFYYIVKFIRNGI